MTFTPLRRIMLMLALVLPLSLAGQGAGAQSLQDNLVAQLRVQGFEDFQITNTWLGRVQIIATGPEFRREIVFNPHTGEILRDYLSTRSGTPQAVQLMAPERHESGGTDPAPRPDRDDDDRDDDDDDGDDKDDDQDDDGEED